VSRKKVASILTGVTALGYLATAALHSTGHEFIAAQAEQAPPDLRALAPALWLMFSLDLTVLGLILGVIAFNSATGGARYVVVIAGLCPLGAAVLQLIYLGFIPPTALLLAIAALSFVSAALMPGRGRSSGSRTDDVVTR